MTTLVMPLAGVACVFALAPGVRVALGDTPAFELMVVGVVALTTALISFLPRLRAMAPRRRAGYLAVSAAIQAVLVVAYGYATIVALLVAACSDGCD